MPSKNTDADFFKEETDIVLRAMKRRSRQTFDSLKRNSDPRPWIQHQPLVSVGAAAAGGLVAGILLVPTHKQQAANKAAAEAAEAAETKAHATGQPRPGIVGHLENELFRVIRPTLRAFAASAAAALFANATIPAPAPAHSSDDEFAGIPRSGGQI